MATKTRSNSRGRKSATSETFSQPTAYGRLNDWNKRSRQYTRTASVQVCQKDSLKSVGGRSNSS